MVAILLTLIGIPVGVLLDVLIVRLAVREPDEDEEGEPDGEPLVPSLHAEAGALLVEEPSGHALRQRVIVVIATAALFAIAAVQYESARDLAVICGYVCVLLVCAGTDLLSYRVPNVVTYPAILVALALGALMPGADFLNVLCGGLLAGGVLLVPAIFTGGVGMGIGDVKLALFVGFALGFQLVPIALLVMALSGGMFAALLLVSRQRRRGEPIPYAPFISAGGLVTLLGLGSAFTSLT